MHQQPKLRFGSGVVAARGWSHVSTSLDTSCTSPLLIEETLVPRMIMSMFCLRGLKDTHTHKKSTGDRSSYLWNILRMQWAPVSLPLAGPQLHFQVPSPSKGLWVLGSRAHCPSSPQSLGEVLVEFQESTVELDMDAWQSGLESSGGRRR